MKLKQTPATPAALAAQLVDVGDRISRLRIARRLRQAEAAVRAGVSRSTAVAIEKGAPSVAIGQVIRYLDAIAPGKTLHSLLNETDTSVASLTAFGQRKRARALSAAELKTLDF